MKLRSLALAAGIFAVSAALMLVLAIAADLHRHSAIAVLILVIGVPCVLALQMADLLDERRVKRVRLPRARARFRKPDAFDDWQDP